MWGINDIRGTYSVRVYLTLGKGYLKNLILEEKDESRNACQLTRCKKSMEHRARADIMLVNRCSDAQLSQGRRETGLRREIR